jgi:hypothetical protein
LTKKEEIMVSWRNVVSQHPVALCIKIKFFTAVLYATHVKFNILKVKLFKTSSLHYMFHPASAFIMCIKVGLVNCCAFCAVAIGV